MRTDGDKEENAKNKKSIQEAIAKIKNDKVDKRIKGAVGKAEEDSEKPGIITQGFVAGIGTGSGVRMSDVVKARKAALSKVLL
jgi:hypothetical protein